MEFQDKVLTCTTCGRNFSFTAREQDFYKEKGFIEPKHCRECRQQRKMRRESMAQEVPVGIDPGTSRALFEVICAECGKRTQVPFKPLTGKPILCKDCFVQKKNRGTSREELTVLSQEIPESNSDGNIADNITALENIKPISASDEVPAEAADTSSDLVPEDSPDGEGEIDEDISVESKTKTKSERASPKNSKNTKGSAKSSSKDSESGKADIDPLDKETPQTGD